jgi:hypothetical protein
VNAEERDPETNLFFDEFSEESKLKEVIVGTNSTMSRATIKHALGDESANASVRKVRLAFRSFRVATVPELNEHTQELA